jgi:hypothetical protein
LKGIKAAYVVSALRPSWVPRKRGQMTDRMLRVESHLKIVSLSAVESTLEAALLGISQSLVVASDAAHEIACLGPPEDEREAEHDRLLWIGAITASLGELCTPKLRVLAAVVDALGQVAEPGEGQDTRH